MKDKIELRRKEDALYDESGGGNDPVMRAKLDAIGFLRGELDPITDEDMPVPETDENLDKLIAVLKAEKETIAEFSYFGDPNWRMADAQIEICEWAKGS